MEHEIRAVIRRQPLEGVADGVAILEGSLDDATSWVAIGAIGICDGDLSD
jgi:hypothetical protein